MNCSDVGGPSVSGS